MWTVVEGYKSVAVGGASSADTGGGGGARKKTLRLSAIFVLYSNPQMLIFPCPLNFILRSIVTLRRSNAT